VKNRPLLSRVGFAIAGLMAAARSERSFRTQLLAAAAVLVVLVIVRPEPVWWALAVLAVAAVLAAELLNTAIEALADLVQPGTDPRIKRIKDCAAGAVLLAALGAVVVAAAFAWSRLS
jgi:diacylglycerol kinase (ATP)